jgi:hypothetical protein
VQRRHHQQIGGLHHRARFALCPESMKSHARFQSKLMGKLLHLASQRIHTDDVQLKF